MLLLKHSLYTVAVFLSSLDQINACINDVQHLGQGQFCPKMLSGKFYLSAMLSTVLVLCFNLHNIALKDYATFMCMNALLEYFNLRFYYIVYQSISDCSVKEYIDSFKLRNGSSYFTLCLHIGLLYLLL